MSITISTRRASAVLSAGLLLGVVPGAIVSAADAATLPAAKLTATMSKGNSTSGSSQVFNSAAAIPTFAVALAPNKSGQKATLRIKRLVTGTFQPLFTEAFEIGADSKVSVKIRDWHAGGTYNAQWSYAGDKVNRASTSNVLNFKFAGKETDLKAPKVTINAPASATAKKEFSLAIRVTRAEGRFLQKATVYGELYNTKTKSWGSGQSTTVALKPANDSGTVARGSQPVTPPVAGKYRFRAAYLGDAGNGRASSPWDTVIVK